MATVVLEIRPLTLGELGAELQEVENMRNLVQHNTETLSAKLKETTSFVDRSVVQASIKASEETDLRLSTTQDEFSFAHNLMARNPDTRNRAAYVWRTRVSATVDGTQEREEEGEKERDGVNDELSRLVRPGRPTSSSTSLSPIENPSYYLDPRDEEIAQISLLNAKEEKVALEGSGLPVLTEFFLQNVTEPRQEKYQIVETFGKAFLFGYGARQEVYSLNGILLDYKNFDWKSNFINLYRNQLRASAAIKNGHRVRISYRGSVRWGQILSLTVTHSSASLNSVVFSIQMFVERQQDLPSVSDIPSIPKNEPGGEEGTTTEATNSVFVKAPNTPARVISDIREFVLEDNTNKVREGRNRGVWKISGEAVT